MAISLTSSGVVSSSGEAEGDMVSAAVVVTVEHGTHIEHYHWCSSEGRSLTPGILPGHVLPLVFVFSASCEQNLN